MTAKLEPIERSTDRELVVTRIFDAPRSLVFKMWAEPEHMSRWCVPRGFTAPSGGMDFRPGGVWHSHMRSPEGHDYRLRGVYREIVKNERIVFTHAWVDEGGRPGHETLVTVSFADHGKKTMLVFHQAVFESKASRDSHEGGWTECLDSLERYVAND